MKVFFKIIIIVCLLLATPFTICAQAKYFKGYIIQLNGDTMKGEIKMNAKHEADNYSKVAYRKSEGNEIKTFNPTKIKGYMVNNMLFISQKIDDEVMFVRRLSSGTAAQNIYEAQIQYEQINEIKVNSDYYIQKENKEFVKIKSKKVNKLIDDAKAANKPIEVADLGLKEEK